MATHSIPCSQQSIQRIFNNTTISLIRSSINSLRSALPCNKHRTTPSDVQSFSSLTYGSVTTTSLRRRRLHLPTAATGASRRTPLLASCWPSLFPRAIDPFRFWNRPKAAAVLYTLATSSPFSSSSTRPAIMGSIPDSSAPVRIFIAGGSYAGLSACLNLLDLAAGRSPRMSGDEYPHVDDYKTMNVEITIADERDGFYHLIGSPLALADAEYAKKAWVKFSDIPALQQQPNVKVVIGSVTAVDCEARTATTLDTVTKQATVHSYDFFIAASGLRRVWPVVPQSLSRKQYLIEAGEHIHAVSNSSHGVLVVGGGAVGIEMAAELKVAQPHVSVTLAHSRDKLLSSEGLSDECKDTALQLLKESGVHCLMNHRLAKTSNVETLDGSTKYEVEFTNGHKMVTSEVVMAISRPASTTTYMPLSALDEENYIKIRPNLTLVDGTPNAEYHFCAGDAAKWSGIKRCGGAMHGGHYIAYNIHQTVLRDRIAGHEASFRELNEFPPVIGLAVGKKAVAYSPDSGTISGEDVMQAYFRNDLGFTICYDYMQLGGKKTDVVAEVTAEEQTA